MESNNSLRLVVDANVFVSACLSPSRVPGRIIRSILEKRNLTFIVTSEIINEIQTTLTYPRVSKYLKMPKEEVARFIISLEIISDYVHPTKKFGNILDDPDDVKYLECAVEGMADVIISGDKHLLSQKVFNGIPILSPRDAWNHYFET